MEASDTVLADDEDIGGARRRVDAGADAIASRGVSSEGPIVASSC